MIDIEHSAFKNSVDSYLESSRSCETENYSTKNNFLKYSLKIYSYINLDKTLMMSSEDWC